jgi:hypothetical protein
MNSKTQASLKPSLIDERVVTQTQKTTDHRLPAQQIAKKYI